MPYFKNTNPIVDESTSMHDNADYFLTYSSDYNNEYNPPVLEDKSFVAIGYLIISVLYFFFGAIIGGVIVWFFIK